MRLKNKFVSVLATLPLLVGAAFAATPQEIVESAPADTWRTLEPENTLYMDLPSGRIIIELRPDFAPKHVERLKMLTRQGFYDGIMFHRVIEGFMAQGGDPTGTGRGSSKLPNLRGEFMRNAQKVDNFTPIGRDFRAAQVGFIGPIPTGAEPDTMIDFLVDGEIGLWGLHCKGVMSMARSDNPDSANSQFFLMFADSRRALDQRYTIWGRIVDGGENARRISRGEPPKRPTPIVRMRVASDVPADERADVAVLRTDSSVFMDYVKAAGDVSEDGYVKDVCNITVPSKIDGKVEL